MKSSEVIVIGAGVIGVVTALTLQRQGYQVTLVDTNEPATGCSYGNAGLLARSSFMPLASAQTFKQVPAWLLNKNSPLSVRWRYLPTLFPWLLRYLKAGLCDDLFKVGQQIHSLTDSSVERYLLLAKSAGCQELIEQGDYLQVYRTQSAFEKASGDMDCRRQLGFRIDDVDHTQLQALEPGLSKAFKFGHRLYNHAYVKDPQKLVLKLFEQFGDLGGKFIRASAHQIVEEGERCLVQVDNAYLTAEQVVVCAGALSAKLLASSGVEVPLETERGYHIQCAEPGVVLNRPIMEGDSKFIATPMNQGHRFAGTVELGGVDAPLNPQRVAVLSRGAQNMLPGLNIQKSTSWLGLRPTLPDSLPVISFAPNSEKVLYAFGHQHLGLTCAPMTAELVLAMLRKEVPEVDISPFSVARLG